MKAGGCSAQRGLDFLARELMEALQPNVSARPSPGPGMPAVSEDLLPGFLLLTLVTQAALPGAG